MKSGQLATLILSFLCISQSVVGQFRSPQTNGNVCIKTLGYLVKNTAYQKINLGELIHNIRQLRMQLDPVAEASFDPVIANEMSSPKNQKKAAARLRGLEIFGLKMGPGAAELKPSDKTLGMAIEGEDQIREFFQELASPSMTTADDTIKQKIKIAKFIGAAGLVGSNFIAPDLAPVLYPYFAFVTLAQSFVWATKHNFGSFQKHVLNSLDSKNKNSWAHYGEQTLIAEYETKIRLSGIVPDNLETKSTIGAEKVDFSREEIPSQVIMMDYTFAHEGGKPKLYAFLRFSDGQPTGKGTKAKNQILDKAREILGKPVLPATNTAPVPVPVPIPRE